MQITDEMRRVFQAVGRQGGLARAKNLTKKQLSAIGRKAAQARWKNTKKAKPTPTPKDT